MDPMGFSSAVLLGCWGWVWDALSAVRNSACQTAVWNFVGNPSSKGFIIFPIWMATLGCNMLIPNQSDSNGPFYRPNEFGSLGFTGTVTTVNYQWLEFRRPRKVHWGPQRMTHVWGKSGSVHMSVITSPTKNDHLGGILHFQRHPNWRPTSPWTHVLGYLSHAACYIPHLDKW